MLPTKNVGFSLTLLVVDLPCLHYIDRQALRPLLLTVMLILEDYLVPELHLYHQPVFVFYALVSWQTIMHVLQKSSK